MNPNGFNGNAFTNIPQFNPNLAYFYQFPLNSLQYQPFVNMQSPSPFAIQQLQLQQLNAAQTLFNNISAQQTLFMRNTQPMIPQNPPSCLVIDDDSNHSFEPNCQVLRFEHS